MFVIWDVDIVNNCWIYGEKLSFLFFVFFGKYYLKLIKWKYNVGLDRIYIVLIILRWKFFGVILDIE